MVRGPGETVEEERGRLHPPIGAATPVAAGACIPYHVRIRSLQGAGSPAGGRAIALERFGSSLDVSSGGDAREGPVARTVGPGFARRALSR